MGKWRGVGAVGGEGVGGEWYFGNTHTHIHVHTIYYIRQVMTAVVQR